MFYSQFKEMKNGFSWVLHLIVVLNCSTMATGNLMGGNQAVARGNQAVARGNQHPSLWWQGIEAWLHTYLEHNCETHQKILYIVKDCFTKALLPLTERNWHENSSFHR